MLPKALPATAMPPTCRQASAASTYWTPAAVQQHFSRVLTHTSAVDVSALLRTSPSAYYVHLACASDVLLTPKCPHSKSYSHRTGMWHATQHCCTAAHVPSPCTAAPHRRDVSCTTRLRLLLQLLLPHAASRLHSLLEMLLPLCVPLCTRHGMQRQHLLTRLGLPPFLLDPHAASL